MKGATLKIKIQNINQPREVEASDEETRQNYITGRNDEFDFNVRDTDRNIERNNVWK